MPIARIVFFYVLYFFFTLIPFSLVTIFFLGVLPRFKEVFKDFKTALPALTEMLLSFGDWFNSGLWLPFLLLALLLPLLPAWLTARSRDRGNRFMWAFLCFNLMFLFSLIVLSLAVLALFLPLIKLVQSVSGGDTGAGGP
jgi:type II secretory pathway component PulF